MNRKFLGLGVLAGVFLVSSGAYARVDIEPYVSISSTKSISPSGDGEETSTLEKRKEYGLRASIGFFRIMKFQFGVGQSKLTTTEKVSEAKDEYDEIDYEEDLNMSTEDPEREVKTTDTHRNARASLVFDPSFSIFILRAKAGVTARQRILTSQVTGEAEEEAVHGPTFNPHSGVGVGVRFSYNMYALAEYSFYHYKFPEIEPFERQVTVSYGMSL